MSWLDGMIEEGDAASQDQRLDRTAEKLKPGFFTGALDVVGPNLLRGALLETGPFIESSLSSVWQGGLDAAASLLLPEPKFGGKPDVTSAERSSQETLGEGVGEMAKAYRPDPTEVGVAGQIIGEAAAILPRTVVGAVLAGPLGAAAAAGGPAGYSRKRTAMEEGIDENTATWLGVTEGAVTGVGAIIPAAGFAKSFAGDAVLAVGANVGLGMAHRGVSAALLESGGYHAQAAQYRAMDGTAIATDAILGAAFFGIGRATLRRPTTEQVDAALAERNAQHADVDTAPGAPIDAQSAVAHQDALQASIDAINRGESVVLPDNIQSAGFLREIDETPTTTTVRDQGLAVVREEIPPAPRTDEVVPTPRQISERAAREEIDTLVREHEATLPRDPELAPAPRTDTQPEGSASEQSVAAPVKTEPDVVATAGKPTGDGEQAATESPEMQLLRGAVSRNPEAMVRTGYDTDGNPTSARADQVLAEIEAEHATGTREASSYTTAIGCLLGL